MCVPGLPLGIVLLDCGAKRRKRVVAASGNVVKPGRRERMARNLGCSECVIVNGGVKPRGLAPVSRGVFVVHPRVEDAAVPGWMIIAPVRHVEQWDELSPREQGELGELIGEVSAALRQATAAEKIYVNVFAEVVAHLHVHLIARARDLPVEARGPRIFQTAGADPKAADAIAKAVLARLVPPR